MSNAEVLMKMASKAPKLAPKFGRLGLQLQKVSPELLFVAGTVAVVGGVVLACRSTLKVDSILDKSKTDLDHIAETVENEPEEAYSNDDATKDRAKVYVTTAIDLTRVYLPAITTVGLGIACFAASHNIQHQRIAGLAAAYKTVESGLKSYRGRVETEIGSDREKEVYYGSHKEKIETIETDPETGKEKKVKKEIHVIEDNGLPSEFAVFYDESCDSWQRSMDYNMDYLKMQQSYFNDRLHLMGHVMLSEVFDALGIDRTPASLVTGWLDNGDGDNYIDFGLTDYFYNGRYGQDYVNGATQSILLDFNVDGVIWDKIG